MNALSIKLLGRLEVCGADGVELRIDGSKQKGLLAYLALNLDRPPTRDQVANLLWGDRFDDQARQSLRQAVFKLRKTLNGSDDSLIWSDAERIGLNAEAVTVDALDFERNAIKNTPEAAREATQLYRDSLLKDLNIGKAEFEDWLRVQRARFNEMACQVLDRHAAHLVQAGDAVPAIEIMQRLIALDPLREPSHRALMRILAQSGRRAAALKQYKSCAEILRNELRVEPDAETKRLHDEIRAAEPAANLAADPLTPFLPPSSAAVSVGLSKPTIAVSAFESIGDELEQQLLASGFTEDVRSGLAKNRWLSVIAIRAKASNPQDALRVQDDAKGLGAQYVVEGTVRQFAKRLRVSVNLIDLRSGVYIWVQRYDRDIDDILSIQDDITASIVAMIEPELASAEGRRVRGKSADEMSAWDCYHLGLETQYQFTKESNAEAQRLFRRAIELDPDFGAAYARLSYAMVISAIYFEADQNSGLLDEALRLAKQATRLDDRDAVSHFALGRTYLAMGEYERSVGELEAAIRLNPSLAQAHCGLGDSLAYAGRLNESVSAFEEAVRLSPQDPYRWAFLMYGSIAYLFMKKYEEAVEWASEAVRVPNSHYWANAALVSALGHLGGGQNAADALAELLRLKPDFTCRFARERLFYLRNEEQVNRYIEGLRKANVPA